MWLTHMHTGAGGKPPSPTSPIATPAEPINVATRKNTEGDSDLGRRIYEQKKPPKVSVTDFETLSVIGEGLVGEVYLVRRYADKKLYAMKVIPKQAVAEANMIEHMRAESKLQAEMSEHGHPFLAKLHYSFQDRGSLYLILEFVPGGDIAFHLNSKVKLPEEVVRFLAAELYLALEHLHESHVVHRDVKAFYDSPPLPSTRHNRDHNPKLIRGRKCSLGQGWSRETH